MLDVARKAGVDAPVSLAAVAGGTHLSRGYLEQLALSLRNAQLLRGLCGKGGGYRLARSPETITVRQVIEAVIGPINIVECVINPSVCPRCDYCECRPVYTLINQRITEALDGFTLADLLQPERQKALRAHMNELATGDDGPAGAPAPAGGFENEVGLAAASPRAKTREGGCPGG